MSEGKKRGAREERGAQDFGGLSGEARGILVFSQLNSPNSKNFGGAVMGEFSSLGAIDRTGHSVFRFSSGRFFGLEKNSVCRN